MSARASSVSSRAAASAGSFCRAHVENGTPAPGAIQEVFRAEGPAGLFLYSSGSGSPRRAFATRSGRLYWGYFSAGNSSSPTRQRRNRAPLGEAL